VRPLTKVRVTHGGYYIAAVRAQKGAGLPLMGRPQSPRPTPVIFDAPWIGASTEEVHHEDLPLVLKGATTESSQRTSGSSTGSKDAYRRQSSTASPYSTCTSWLHRWTMPSVRR
jgi:hypothetical protein